MALPRGQYPNNGRFGHGRAKPVQRFDPLVTTSTLADPTPASPLGGKVSSSYLWSDTVSVSLSPTTNGGTAVSFDSSDIPLSYADVRNGLGSKITYSTFLVGQLGSSATGYEIDQSFIEFDTSSFFGPTSTTSGNTATQYDTVTLDFTIPALSDNTANDFVVQIWGDSINATNIWSGTFGTSQFVTGTNLSFISSITTPVATFNTSTISAGSTVSIVIPKTCLNTSGGKTRLLITSANNTNGVVPTDFVYEYFVFVPKLTFNKFLTPTSTLFTTLNASNSGYVTANSVAGTVADILNGGAIRQATIGASVQVGVSQTNSQGYAGYVEFNTSNYIGTVSSAALSLSINTDNSVSNFGIEVYKLDYGTLTPSDWVNPSSPALTLVGNVNTSELVGQSSITIPLSISSVSFSTPTRLLLYSSFIKAGVGNPVDNSYVNLTPTALAITIASPIAGGPASTTLGAATSAASGSSVATATSTKTLEDATAVAVGAQLAVGSVAASLSDSTALGAGSPVVAGDGVGALDSATVAASGSSVGSGAAASTLSNSTVGAAGSPVVTTSVATTTENATVASLGSPIASGSVGATIGDATTLGVGSPVVAASGSSTLGNATSTAVGTGITAGSASVTLGPLSVTGVGTSIATGGASVPLNSATASATGTTLVNGALIQTLGNATLTASGTPIISASATVSTTDASTTVSGSAITNGAANASLTSAISVAQGTTIAVGYVTTTLSGAVGAGSALQIIGTKLYRWNGTAWVKAPLKKWNGTAWVDAGTVKAFSSDTGQWVRV